MREGPSAAPLTNADAERSLAALERWAADPDRPVIVLAGAAKAGKTVVLDVLASRLGRYFSIVYLSGSGSDPDELSARILAAIGDAKDGTPRLVLAREIERRTARPLVLLLDDADTLPPRVELWLFDLARRSEGALRVVLALSDARLARELAEAFRAGTEIVSIDTSMEQAEAESYLRLVAARASESAPASFPRRAAGPVAPGPVPSAPPEPRSDPRPAEPAEPVPALASTAGPPPLRASGRRPRAAARSAPSTPAVAASQRVRAEAPSQAPRGAAVSDPARNGLRLRWVALAAALVLAFVAGFFLSELRDARRPGLVATANVGAPADLPSVSAPMPMASPALAPAPRSALPTGSAAADAPAPDPGADRTPLGGTPLGARPDPVSLPASPGATRPVDGRDGSELAENAPVASARAPDEARAQDATAPDSRMSAEAAIPIPMPAITPEPEMPTASTDDGVGGLRSSADAEEPVRTSERPAVSAAPPVRPRVVKVQVQAEPGTEIRIGGRALGAAPVGAVDLPPGAHRLVVRMPDGREVERIVEVSGSRYEIQVR